jgi:predicted peptidase
MPKGFYQGEFHGDPWSSGEPVFTVNYGLYLPEHLQDQEGLPLIVFLHDSDGIEKSRLFRSSFLSALGKMSQEKGSFDFIAFAPVNPTARWHPESTEVVNIIKTLDYLVRQYRIDPSRIYLCGLAGGGDGVWRLAETYPEKWAAIVPVHASYLPDVRKMGLLPIWIFDRPQGERSSPTQNAAYSELQRTSSDSKYTHTTKGREGVLAEVFQSQALYDWLSKKKR